MGRPLHKLSTSTSIGMMFAEQVFISFVVSLYFCSFLSLFLHFYKDLLIMAKREGNSGIFVAGKCPISKC